MPTPKEWEYACRAGTTTKFHTGDILSEDQANFGHPLIYENIRKVGSYPPNSWGLYDMHGNVGELATHIIKSKYGVEKEWSSHGGSYYDTEDNCASDHSLKYFNRSVVGFRVVMEIESSLSESPETQNNKEHQTESTDEAMLKSPSESANNNDMPGVIGIPDGSSMTQPDIDVFIKITLEIPPESKDSDIAKLCQKNNVTMQYFMLINKKIIAAFMMAHRATREQISTVLQIPDSMLHNDHEIMLINKNINLSLMQYAGIINSSDYRSSQEARISVDAVIVMIKYFSTSGRNIISMSVYFLTLTF